MKKQLLILLLVLLSSPLAAQTVKKSKPDLVILLAVDQLREDYLHRFRPQFTGGFKRLVEEGAFFTNAFQDHASTVTAVGHASMLSGRFPRSTGIITNALGVPDPQARMLNGRAEGASPFRFRGTTLFDWIRVQDPQSRAFSVSVKDRSAILPLGRAKQSVYWYSTDGTFTTSNYYADTLPTWLRTFNATKFGAKYAGMEWRPLLPVRMYPEADTVPLEGGGKDVSFPHALPTEISRAFEQLANFPWMDEILLDVALMGADSMKLGRSGHTDLLSVSLSTTDLIGHRFGPDSREVHDQILRLDRALGVFLDSLYARFPREKILIVLTADHGVSSFPELHEETDTAKDGGSVKEGHVPTQPLLAKLRPILTANNLPGNAVSFDTGMLMFDERLFNHDHVLMDSVARVFAREARKTRGVVRVDWVRNLAHGDTIRDMLTRRWNQTIPRDLAIPLVATLREGYVWGTGASATHGSPYDADAHVPIIFFGPQFKRGFYKQFARTVDIAPTLAEVLDVHPTERLDGRVLRQALK